MKKASKFLKLLFSAIVEAVKAGSTSMRTRTSAVRTRLIIFGILRNKRLLMSAINSKIHAIMGGGKFTSNHGSAEGEGRGAGEHVNGHHLLAGGGGRKAAVLQSLPSFVVEQEKRAVVLLNSLPSFAMDRDGGGGDYGEQQYDVLPRSPLVGGEEAESNEDGKWQLANAPQPSGSVIELVRSAAENGGAEFRLEDEIDHVADVFIRRFHDQMKLQKLESFKRFCEMFERN